MSMDETISVEEAARITAYLDVDTPPRKPTAHIIFGTNQGTPAELVAHRHHRGLAPFIILTGGVNRHTGVVEAIEHRRILMEHGVPESAMRCAGSSTTTQGNAESALSFLREALDVGLAVTAVCKWYHRRAVQQLRVLLPEVPFFHAVTWEPIYDRIRVTRSDWWLTSPVTAQRVLKEWRVIPERLAAGSLKEVALVDRTWR
jgi:uncharacterized SAM-binding protein YcdF (DUF218 family)